MYCVLDRKRLAFLPLKHWRLDVVCDLVELEASNEYVHIFSPYEPNSLKVLADWELISLYKNTTGKDKIPTYGEPLRRICVEFAQRIPETSVAPHLLAAQVNGLPQLRTRAYKYKAASTVAIECAMGERINVLQFDPAPNELELGRLPIAKAPARPAGAFALPGVPPTGPTYAIAAGGPAKPWEQAAKAAAPAPTAQPTAPVTNNPQIVAPWLK